MKNYISVTEYANLYHKDPGNIRRHLASGRMSGQKIGNQWVIPRDEKYPSDERCKSGKYRGWRKRIAINADRELKSVLMDVTSDMISVYGKTLKSIILYGSYARGTQTAESDIDIALLLDRKPGKRQKENMIDRLAQHELECGRVLSVVDIQKSQFDIWKESLPFYMNIEKEGIELWKTE